MEVGKRAEPKWCLAGNQLFAGRAVIVTSLVANRCPQALHFRYRMRTPGHGFLVQTTVSRTPRQWGQNRPIGLGDGTSAPG